MSRYAFALISIIAATPFVPSYALAADSGESLEAAIKQYQAKQDPDRISSDDRAIMQQARRDLEAAMPDPGLDVGQGAPDFTLPNAFGEKVSLSDALAQGPVVLTFYRGAWCPYCNLELKALRDALPRIESHGAQLIAVTPQLPDRSIEQVRDDGYQFEILSDLNDRVMKAYNLYFEVPQQLNEVYMRMGLDLESFNGEGRRGLPVPGTFVIDKQGVIRAAFADVDYTKRMEPADILTALDALR